LSVFITGAFFCVLKADIRIPTWLTRFASGIAAYSYTLYLIHYTVMEAIPPSVLYGWARVLAVFAVSNIVSIALYFAFERHHKKVATWLRGLRLHRATT
jgi:peptidoglycan/LPS O-acetylase OafA/YrhL